MEALLIIQNIYVRDVYNEDGKFKSINDFANILVNKSNYICEYIVLKRIFATLSCKFDCKKAAYVNIKSRELFLFGDRNRHVNSTAFGGSLPLFECIFRLPTYNPDLPLFVQSPSFQSLGVVHTFRLRLGHCLPPL